MGRLNIYHTRSSPLHECRENWAIFNRNGHFHCHCQSPRWIQWVQTSSRKSPRKTSRIFADNTDTHSTIYKYDIHEKKFDLAQKLRTNAAVDCKYFRFKQNDVSEHFLIVANSNEMQETASVIYKFVDGFFTPFQSIHFDAIVTQFLPVLVSAEERPRLWRIFWTAFPFSGKKQRVCADDFTASKGNSTAAI